MRPVPTLLAAALLLAPLGCIILSLRQESSAAPISLLHRAPGISGHWGGAAAAAHRPHDRSTLAGSVTSWNAYLYGGLSTHAIQPSAAASAAPTRARPAAPPASLLPPSPSPASALSAAANTEAAAARQPYAQHALAAARAPSCVLQPSLLPSPPRNCPRVFSPVCGCNGVVYRQSLKPQQTPSHKSSPLLNPPPLLPSSATSARASLQECRTWAAPSATCPSASRSSSGAACAPTLSALPPPSLHLPPPTASGLHLIPTSLPPLLVHAATKLSQQQRRRQQQPLPHPLPPSPSSVKKGTSSSSAYAATAAPSPSCRSPPPGQLHNPKTLIFYLLQRRAGEHSSNCLCRSSPLCAALATKRAL